MSNLINKAKKYAYEKHGSQKDDGGNPFVFHPLMVSTLLSIVRPDDANLIAAGALHDVIEDCNMSYEELKKEFNEDIASLVYEVTHEKPNPTKPAIFPRLITERGIILKFTDRLHNLSRMGDWDHRKKQWYLKSSKFWKSEL